MSERENNNKKHIAMYIGSLQKGGAERVMSNLADYFFEQGYKVTLVTTYLAPNEYEVRHAAWKSVPQVLTERSWWQTLMRIPYGLILMAEKRAE